MLCVLSSLALALGELLKNVATCFPCPDIDVCVCMWSVRTTLTPRVFKQGVQAPHPALHQRRHRMCAGDISEGRLVDVPAISDVAESPFGPLFLLLCVLLVQDATVSC